MTLSNQSHARLMPDVFSCIARAHLIFNSCISFAEIQRMTNLTSEVIADQLDSRFSLTFTREGIKYRLAQKSIMDIAKQSTSPFNEV